MKQRNIPWLGAFIDSMYTTMPMLSIINFGSILIVLYTNIREYLLPIFPWMKLYWFLGSIALLAFCLMLFVYIFVLPSIWTFRGKQMHSYDSEVAKDLAEIKELLVQLKNKSSID